MTVFLAADGRFLLLFLFLLLTRPISYPTCTRALSTVLLTLRLCPVMELSCYLSFLTPTHLFGQGCVKKEAHCLTDGGCNLSFSLKTTYGRHLSFWIVECVRLWCAYFTTGCLTSAFSKVVPSVIAKSRAITTKSFLCSQQTIASVGQLESDFLKKKQLRRVVLRRRCKCCVECS